VYKQWAGYSIGYVAQANRYAEWLICLCLFYTSQMLNHKCCCYTYLLCAIVGFTLRLGHRGYITSPRPRPLSSKCLIYIILLLYSHPSIHFQHDLSCLQKVSLIYLYLCCCFVDCCTFFLLLFLLLFPVWCGCAHAGFSITNSFTFLYMCCALKQWRGRETLTSNAIGGRYKKQNTVLLMVCI
jgi:hypothetical protein